MPSATTPSARVATAVFMLFPVRPFDRERLQERADLRDLRVVENLLPRRHLAVGPSVLHDRDEFAVATPELAQVGRVFAESRHAICLGTVALYAPHRVELTAGGDRLRVPRDRGGSRRSRPAGLPVLRGA